MAGATFNWGSWLPVLSGANHLAFMLDPPPLAASFLWFKAVLIFLLAMIIVALSFGVNNTLVTIQGNALWLLSSILLTIALLWLFGLIPGSTVFRLFIWGLYGLAGLVAVSLVLSPIAWLVDRKSKKSKDLK